jgi:hypothetical protein
MRVLQLPRFAEARVWFGKSVIGGFKSEGVITGTTRQSYAGGQSSNMIVGLEALVPCGGYAQYGLLELEFLPDDLARLRLEVPYSSMTGTAWPGALAGILDEVRLGLPKEYAPAVLASLSSAVEGRIPSGVLRIVAAAHGLVGSSPNFFGKIARAAVELALLGEDEVPDDRLVSLLRGIIVN